MAYYTPVNKEIINELMNKYSLGTLRAFFNIPKGITNTNYWVETDTHQLILTIFEQTMSQQDLYFIIELTNFLHSAHLPCPIIFHDRKGNPIQSINDKPTIIRQALEGATTPHSSIAYCAAVGDFLGRLHATTPKLHLQIPNPCGIVWRSNAVEKLLEFLPTADALLLQEEMGFQKTLEYHLLPRGIIHADLFKDNVLFIEEKLTGVINFYYACYDDLLLDIAIAINAWCRNEDNEFQETYINALLTSYQKHRILSPLEKMHLNDVRRTAALRFWISRLIDVYIPEERQMTHALNPDEFRDILKGLSHIPKL